MPTSWDLALAACISLLMPLRAFLTKRRIERLGPSEQALRRPAVWRQAMLWQWSLVAAVAALWITQDRSPSALGLVPHPTAGLLGVGLGVAVMAVLVGRQRASVGTDRDLRVRIRERLAAARPILPHERREYPGFVPLAITAGVCEELLFRGFLWWVAAAYLPQPLAALPQVLLFGVGHLYQGRRGVMLTGIVGAFLTLVVLITGSLPMAMLVHVLIDLHAGDMAWRTFERDAEDAQAAHR